MAITALISVVAYTGLSSALSGAESLRSAAGVPTTSIKLGHCCREISVRSSTDRSLMNLVRWCQRYGRRDGAGAAITHPGRLAQLQRRAAQHSAAGSLVA